MFNVHATSCAQDAILSGSGVARGVVSAFGHGDGSAPARLRSLATSAACAMKGKSPSSAHRVKSAGCKGSRRRTHARYATARGKRRGRCRETSRRSVRGFPGVGSTSRDRFPSASFAFLWSSFFSSSSSSSSDDDDDDSGRSESSFASSSSSSSSSSSATPFAVVEDTAVAVAIPVAIRSPLIHVGPRPSRFPKRLAGLVYVAGSPKSLPRMPHAATYPRQTFAAVARIAGSAP